MKDKRITIKPDATWEGQPCVVMASGPSLGFDDYADVKLVEQCGIKTIAVNSTWKDAPWCDVLYAGDGIWWKYNHKDVDIDAEKWSCSKNPSILYGVKYRPRHIKPGYNSGANAVELAVNVYKASTVIMLGFDCSVKHGVHHHANHKHTRNPDKDRCSRWKPQFKNLKQKTKHANVINCSRYTEITHFPRADLRETLCKLGLI